MKLLLLLLSGLKLGKLLTTGGTMLLSIVTYAFFYGWRYAVGFVALLFVHEMGHFLAARQRGLDVGAPTFIPFVGAWIELKRQLPDAETEAFVGLGGPLLGSIGAWGVYWWAQAHHTPWLLAVAYAGFFLNLFNLIPLSPLDGGRITAVLGPRVWLLGVPVLLGLFLYRPSPMLVLIAVLAVPQLLQAVRGGPPSGAGPAYYAVRPAIKLEYGAYYLLLLAFLGLMTHRVHEQLGSWGA